MAQLATWWHWLPAGVAQLVAQLRAWWPLLAGVGVAAALYVAWWLWWRLPKRQARRLNLLDDKTRADVEDNFRKTISQVFGGAAVLAGAAFAYVQFMDQRQTSQDQLQASHDLGLAMITAVELLGKPVQPLPSRAREIERRSCSDESDRRSYKDGGYVFEDLKAVGERRGAKQPKPCADADFEGE
jgi:hypothetical protein